MIELAEKSGLTQGHLSKLERGLLPYNQLTLERLAEVLQSTPADLIGALPR